MGRKRALIIGGDKRQYYMAEYLAKRGFEVAAYGEVFAEATSGVQCLQTPKEVIQRLKETDSSVILPVPVTTDRESIKGTGGKLRCQELLPVFRQQKKIYGGSLPENMRNQGEIKQGQYVDFMKSEQVALFNAVATAEGSIAEACSLGVVQLTGSSCLVAGYGRCGEALAHKLKQFGAQVTVMERSRRQRARAQTFGMQACEMQTEQAHFNQYDYIFNTVPALILTEELLMQCKKEAVIIDIASAPGGVDYEAAGRLGIRAKLCPGLPGKYAPKTAGEILAEAVIESEGEQYEKV